MEAAPVSCGHRACNVCGQHKAMEWEARQKARLLPVPYHMVTFTVPSEFRALFRANQRLCYDLFFKESAGALMDLAADPRHLGGAIGMTGVLHTWRRDLRYHPHIHYIVPAGALTDTGWRRLKNPDIFVLAPPLAVRMRNRFRQALKAADFNLYLSLPHQAWIKPWNAYAKPVGRGDTAFGYLARYVQKSAIDAARIVNVSDSGVTIRWTHRKSGTARTETLSGEEFLRRFLQHVLPRGLTRVRHFGFLSAAAKARYERVRSLLRAGAVRLVLPINHFIAAPPAAAISCNSSLCSGLNTVESHPHAWSEHDNFLGQRTSMSSRRMPERSGDRRRQTAALPASCRMLLHSPSWRPATPPTAANNAIPSPATTLTRFAQSPYLACESTRPAPPRTIFCTAPSQGVPELSPRRGPSQDHL